VKDLIQQNHGTKSNHAGHGHLPSIFPQTKQQENIGINQENSVTKRLRNHMHAHWG